MTKRAKKRGMATNEVEFVRRYVRTGVHAEHIAAFRECHIEGSDRPEGQSLTLAFNRFLNREDVKFAILTESRRYDMALLKAHREADAVTADGLISDAEGLQIVKDSLVLAVVEERERLNNDPKRTAGSLAKLGAEYGKIVARDGKVDEDVDLDAAKKLMADVKSQNGAPEEEGRKVPATEPDTNARSEKIA
jgi:hypothetical protein